MLRRQRWASPAMRCMRTVRVRLDGPRRWPARRAVSGSSSARMPTLGCADHGSSRLELASSGRQGRRLKRVILTAMASHALHADGRPRPMTLEEWADLPEDDEGELVDGHLTEEEVPDFLHELVVAWFIRVLGNWVAPRGGSSGARRRSSPSARGAGASPTRWSTLPGRRPPARGLIRVPPDIVLEVVSPRPRDGRRDRVEKLADYADLGVRWYWLLDPELRTLEVLELGADGRYAHALSATGRGAGGGPGLRRVEPRPRRPLARGRPAGRGRRARLTLHGDDLFGALLLLPQVGSIRLTATSTSSSTRRADEEETPAGAVRGEGCTAQVRFDQSIRPRLVKSSAAMSWKSRRFLVTRGLPQALAIPAMRMSPSARRALPPSAVQIRAA